MPPRRLAGALPSPLVARVLSVTVGAAAANLAVIKDAMRAYSHHNSNNDMQIVILAVATSCLAHQTHICSRSCMASLSADPFRPMPRSVPFILGLTTSCAVFLQATHTVKLLKTLVRFCSGIDVIPAEALPDGGGAAAAEKCLEQATLGRIALTNYFVQWFRKGAAPDSRPGIAIDVIARVCNTE